MGFACLQYCTIPQPPHPCSSCGVEVYWEVVGTFLGTDRWAICQEFTELCDLPVYAPQA